VYVCLCHGVTSHEVEDCIAKGACTSKAVAMMCGAGSECGRCRRTVRAIINSLELTPESR
jgi:bacterioferritin-associated ferredoxin